MKPALLRCCFALFALSGFLSLARSGKVFRQIKEHVRWSQELRAHKHLQLYGVGGGPWPKAETLRQPLDHFNRQNNATFPQRFFVNDGFWHPQGPVFLFIGGESSISEYSVLSGHHVDMAQRYSALVVALEHRYYGASINPDGLSLENIRFLSSQQALADLSSFHLYITRRFNLTRNNTWLCFGGSYPGSLSAWFRLKFPHLVFAAVASSAPVRAQLDFTGYNKVVAESLSNPVVGGSEKCRQAVSAGFRAVDAKLKAGNLSELQKDFLSCGSLVLPEDQSELVSNLADIFMGTVQYNHEGAGYDIAAVCDIMVGGGEGESSYTRLTHVLKDYLARMALSCLDCSFQKSLLELQSTRLDPVGVGERQWVYQTCTEFGYYQTCEDPLCPFSSLLSLSSQLQLCSQVFGISSASVGPAVTFTNEFYGADHPKSSRILFVNGDIDPWHALGVLKDRSHSERAILINGTAHCADMNPTQPQDPPPLTLARQQIDKQVGDWLEAARKEFS
ncbi:thymus-specific serine protease [Huso huso]|uniref:Thymus-specific serine protease n=1 Tax=Huso huso TaxID=61971 RepID=A0ABR0YDX2_HUSHU